MTSRDSRQEHKPARLIAPNYLEVDDAIHLRRLAGADDINQLTALLQQNAPYIGEFLPWVHGVGTKQVARFVDIANQAAQKGERAPYGVFYKEQLVGHVALHSFFRKANAARLGYYQAEHASGRGVMTRALGALVVMGINHMSLDRVFADINPANHRSRRVVERLGAKRVGNNGDEDIFVISKEGVS